MARPARQLPALFEALRLHARCSMTTRLTVAAPAVRVVAAVSR
ncbi:hypothetical protein ACFQY4_18315 [Catellatospora bangladeshensis]